MPRKAKSESSLGKSEVMPNAEGFGLGAYAVLSVLFKEMAKKGMFSREELEGIIQKAMTNLTHLSETDLTRSARFALESLSFASEITRGLDQTQEATDGGQA